MIQSSPAPQDLIFPMNEAEARSLTNEIRADLRRARDNVLAIYQREGWKSLGYGSFRDWAMGEFEVSWQQVYNMKAAAEFDNELSLFSARGEAYQIPVKHATQLRKLDTPEARVRAYQLAEQQASAQGKDAPTEKIVEAAVIAVKAEETVFESPYPVVRQMLAEASLTAPQAKQITLELNELKDEAAQAYIQKLMADYGLTNPELVFPLGHKFLNERRTGKVSTVLQEIENTKGFLDGTPLSRATVNDLKRANAQGHSEHRSDGVEQKRQKQMATGQPIEEQFALTLWKNGPIRSAKELIKRLPPKDLEAVFHLLAQKLGYVQTDAYAQLLEDEDLIGVEFMLHQAGSFESIEEGQDLQVLTRVKPINISINGKAITVHQSRELSFEQLVALAFPDVHHSNYGNFTIQYGDFGSGSLFPMQAVTIREGMAFDVMDKALPRE